MSKYKIGKTTLREWRYKYRKYGIDGLRESKAWKGYTKEIKEEAVNDYLSGEYSIEDITRKYEISSTSVLRKWIKSHTGHRELKAFRKGMSRSVTKGRNTSLTERIEIVNYCIAHNNDYHNAAETYRVSYQQVYQKYYLHKYDKYEDLARAIDEYMSFYNSTRLQKRINGLSPMEFRAEAA